MPTRRDVVGMLMATAAGTFLRGPGNAIGGVVQPQHDRRRVVIGGRAIRVIDMHAHCVIPVTDIVQGTPLASSGGGRGGSILGPERLQLMDQQGVDVQALQHQRLLVVRGRSGAGAPDRSRAEQRASPSGSRNIPIGSWLWRPSRCSIRSWRPNSWKMASSGSVCVECRSEGT